MSCRRELNLWTFPSFHYVNDLFSYLQITMVIQCVSYLIVSLSKGSEILKSVFFLLNYDRPFISNVVHLIWYQYISNQITVGDCWCWKTKKCFFSLFLSFNVVQPDDHTGWASMPSASIYPICPRTNPWKSIENWWNWKIKYFLSRPSKFFLLHPHENQSKFIG